MYNVLLILLHRPFVADGHLHSNARSIAVNSLFVCANAAASIVQIVRLYHAAFSIQRAPYLIAYATYVSATIHIRIAAKRSPDSDAHRSLATCLKVFRINQETNWAARRAKTIVEGLSRKLGIQLPDTRDALTVTRDESYAVEKGPPQPSVGEQISGHYDDAAWQQGFSPTMDVDAIIQSFAREPDQPQVNLVGGMGGLYQQDPPHHGSSFPENLADYPGDIGGQDWTNAQDFSFDDLLFGFNNSMLDNLHAAPLQ